MILAYGVKGVWHQMANKDAYEEQMDRREFRRKRRIRNQIISYIVTVIVLGGLVAGGIIGAGQVMKTVRDKKQADELQKQLDELHIAIVGEVEED